MRNFARTTDSFIAIGAAFCSIGVAARALSSHAIRQLLLEQQTLDNFNLAADYLVLHGLALIGAGVLVHLFPTANYHRAGFMLIAGTLLFGCSVLAKSLVSIDPFGFITPLGGLFLITGWILVAFCALSSFISGK